MINEASSCSDQTVVSDRDSFSNVEFDASSNVTMVTDLDVRSGLRYAITIIEYDAVQQVGMVSNGNLIGPVALDVPQSTVYADPHPQCSPIGSAYTGSSLAISVLKGEYEFVKEKRQVIKAYLKSILWWRTIFFRLFGPKR